MAGEQLLALGMRVSPHGNPLWSDESEVADEDEDDVIEILSSCADFDDEDKSDLEAELEEVLNFERFVNSVNYKEPRDPHESGNEVTLCVLNSSCEECAGNEDTHSSQREQLLTTFVAKLHDLKRDHTDKQHLFDTFQDIFNLLLETTASKYDKSVQVESGESPLLELEEVALSPTEIRFPDSDSSSFFASAGADADCSEMRHPGTPSTSEPVSDASEFTDVSDAMSGDDHANPQKFDTSQGSASTDPRGTDLERISGAPSDGGVGKQSLHMKAGASVKRFRHRFKAFRSKTRGLNIVATTQLLAPASFRLVLRRPVITSSLPEPFWEMCD